MKINTEHIIVKTSSGFTVRALTRSEQMRLMDRAGYTTNGVVTVPAADLAAGIVEDGYKIVPIDGQCEPSVNALGIKRDSALALIDSILKRGYAIVAKSTMSGRSLIADAEFTRLLWAASVVDWPYDAEASEEELMAFADRYPTVARSVMREADALIVAKKNEELESLRSGVNGTTHPEE